MVNWAKGSLFIIALLLAGGVFTPDALAHRSGCHRWHSCPSDSGSYTCGDAGYACQYPTYPKSGGAIYPPNGYYKDCYDCQLKKVPSNAHTSGIGWSCNSGYIKSGNICVPPIATSITYNLANGMQNGQVTKLQQILSRYPDIYPEKVISGYFGSATELALKRFQKKYGLEQTGSTGPKTRAILNKL